MYVRSSYKIIHWCKIFCRYTIDNGVVNNSRTCVSVSTDNEICVAKSWRSFPKTRKSRRRRDKKNSITVSCEFQFKGIFQSLACIKVYAFRRPLLCAVITGDLICQVENLKRTKVCCGTFYIFYFSIKGKYFF